MSGIFFTAETITIGPSMEARVHRLVVPRTARYVTLGAIDDNGNPQDVWLLCHGYGQLASQFLDSAGALEHPGRVLVAPEALSRFYHEDHKRRLSPRPLGTPIKPRDNAPVIRWSSRFSRTPAISSSLFPRRTRGRA